jgi:hypothetical protein
MTSLAGLHRLTRSCKPRRPRGEDSFVLARDRPVSKDLFSEEAKPGRCCKFNCEHAKEMLSLSRSIAAAKRSVCSAVSAFAISSGVAIGTSTRSCPMLFERGRVEATSNSHYAGWENDGKLITTPGNMTDYAWIADDIVKTRRNFVSTEVPHDPYHAAAW